MKTVLLPVFDIVWGYFLATRSRELSEWTVDRLYKIVGYRYPAWIFKYSFLVGGIGSVVLGVLIALKIISIE